MICLFVACLLLTACGTTVPPASNTPEVVVTPTEEVVVTPPPTVTVTPAEQLDAWATDLPEGDNLTDISQPYRMGGHPIRYYEHANFYLIDTARDIAVYFGWVGNDKNEEYQRSRDFLDFFYSLLPLVETDPQPNAEALGGFYFVEYEGYSRCATMIVKPNCIEINDRTFLLTDEQQQQFEAIFNDNEFDIGTAMCTIDAMNRRVGIEKLEITNEQGVLTEYYNNLYYALTDSTQRTDKVSTYALDTVELSELPRMVVTFTDGVVYTLAIQNRTVYVTFSDRPHGYTFTVESDYDWFAYLRKLTTQPNMVRTAKPVIYLYPEQTQDVAVTLDFDGSFTYTYPRYDNGWRVTAQPDGMLTNRADGTQHYYLFWEGTPNTTAWDLSSGFVVKGSDVEAFWLEKLPYLGLAPREYNDFITYWVPEMCENAYNLITFSTVQYERLAQLTVTPAPDTIIRVHMVWKALDAPVELPEQRLQPAPVRNGFTVVEWGGTRIW